MNRELALLACLLLVFALSSPVLLADSEGCFDEFFVLSCIDVNGVSCNPYFYAYGTLISQWASPTGNTCSSGLSGCGGGFGEEEFFVVVETECDGEIQQFWGTVCCPTYG